MFKSLFNKVAGLQTCNFIKKRNQHRCFPMRFAKFVRAPFLQNTFGGYFRIVKEALTKISSSGGVARIMQLSKIESFSTIVNG